MAESEPVLKTKGRRKSIPGAGSIKHKGPAVEPGKARGTTGRKYGKSRRDTGAKVLRIDQSGGAAHRTCSTCRGIWMDCNGKEGL